MPTQAIDVADIVTHKDIVDEMGSERELRNVLTPDPNNVEDPTKTFRELAYRDVLKALERRTPPVTESMLSNRDDIKDAIRYGTLARLYRQAITSDGDGFSVKWKHWQGQFNAEVIGLRVRTNDGDVDAGNLSFPVMRR